LFQNKTTVSVKLSTKENRGQTYKHVCCAAECDSEMCSAVTVSQVNIDIK